MFKSADALLSIDINESEQRQAKKVRSEFKKLVANLDGVFKSLGSLNAGLIGLDENPQLSDYRYLFLKYRQRVQFLFNRFLDQFEHCLKELEKMVSDRETLKLKNSIIGEVRELRDGVLTLLELLREPGRQEFVKMYRETFLRLDQRQSSLSEIITDSLFGHIDNNILGQIKIGKSKFRLSKRG